ncbi:MAG: flagellar protein [Agathobacter sp.]|nr:flagellar protein [Agathobacter sp.]
MKPITNQFKSIEQITDQFLNQKSTGKAGKPADISFEEVLRQQQDLAAEQATELKFSRHAASRLESRGINLSTEQSARLESGVEQAKAKGINESLVLVDSLAFIVNVPNRTVVTAMDQEETNSNIFTNIDGAVIM